MPDDTLDKAYQLCQQIARQHYENFPTASRLLAPAQRRATAAIYAFARTADDIADEGDLTPAERHRQLEDHANKLSQLTAGVTPEAPIFIALADTIQRFQLPVSPFEKLLCAFHADIDTQRFAGFVELSAYCANSANPIGELVLRLHNAYYDDTKQFSDPLCTALQLLNFMQDLHSDYQQRGRIYIPLDEMQEFGVTESDLAQRRQTGQLEQLIAFQLARVEQLLSAGRPLIQQVHGRLKILLHLTYCSAERMLQKLRARTDVFARPTLHAGDIALILSRSLVYLLPKLA